jgi:MOSC domain-containing protein YiiM
VRLAITSFAVPCSKIAGAFVEGGYHRLSQKLHPGWSRVYARVLASGTVRLGDEVVLLQGCPEPVE